MKHFVEFAAYVYLGGVLSYALRSGNPFYAMKNKREYVIEGFIWLLVVVLWPLELFD